MNDSPVTFADFFILEKTREIVEKPSHANVSGVYKGLDWNSKMHTIEFYHILLLNLKNSQDHGFF